MLCQARSYSLMSDASQTTVICQSPCDGSTDVVIRTVLSCGAISTKRCSKSWCSMAIWTGQSGIFCCRAILGFDRLGAPGGASTTWLTSAALNYSNRPRLQCLIQVLQRGFYLLAAELMARLGWP